MKRPEDGKNEDGSDQERKFFFEIVANLFNKVDFEIFNEIVKVKLTKQKAKYGSNILTFNLELK